MAIELVRRLFRYTGHDKEFAEAVHQMKAKRSELDKRVNPLFQATLDHEGEWFLQIVKKNPECGLEVIAKCSGGVGFEE